MNHLFFILSLTFSYSATYAQTDEFRNAYDEFRRQAQVEYEDFRNEANKRYADFVRQAWQYNNVLPAIESNPGIV